MTRVNYIERQRLQAVDLNAEQAYLLGLDGRHHLAPHTEGIVCGLFITVEDKKAIVSPGLAVDGYGRELIVFSEVELAVPDKVGEQFIYLSYCERPKDGCEDKANPRWRDTAELTVSDRSWPIPEDTTELSIARAAGNISNYPPCPVLLNVIRRTDSKEYPTLAALHAARVLAPSGRAQMRIGQENLADQYHFLISVADKQGITGKRFAIDRDGNKRVWGNLLLEGTGYSAIVVARQQKLVLSVESPLAVGGEILWRVVPAVDNAGNETLEILFRQKKSTELLTKTVLRPANARSINAAIRNHNNRGGTIPSMSAIRLSDIAAGEAAAPEAEISNTCLLDNREQPLSRAGALLRFLPEKGASDSGVFCGCREDDDPDPKPPPGFIFNPSPSTPTVPDSRDIYSIKTGKVERPIEELRFSNGLFAKGDFTNRFTIGGSQNAKPFQPWLSLRGDGGMELPGGKRDENNQAFEMICVIGTVEYPPVKPDPRDPLFSFLLTFAFINGILSLSSSLVKVAIKAPPFIETGKPDWEYELSVQNLGLTEPLLPLRAIESIISDSGVSKNDDSFQQKLPARVEKQSTVTVKVSHKTADLPPGDTMEIEVSATMTAGSAKVGDKKRSEKIPVYESPTIEDNIPASLSPGTSAQFDVTITNGRSRKLALGPILIDSLGPTQSLTPGSSELKPNQSTTTTKASIPAPAANAPDIKIGITISYLWEGQNVPTESKFTRTVTIESVIL
jgi:hypothetical protein